ncbi:MAG: DUF1552 domain-containing protein [Verrucomicrobia bacterium]|nr:DUF1552 domain-containing protein [Verrucomicrobiota bacterium]
MMNRRDVIRGMAASLGAGMLSNFAQAAPKAAAGATRGPKRIVFFLQNHGFDPYTCIPKGLEESCPLDGVTLSEPMQALEPYKDRMHIITGLHGLHVGPAHSAYFGALGGYRCGMNTAPADQTIDYALSRILPETILSPLGIGMESMESMKALPTIATLTAAGPGLPMHMHSDPNKLYEVLFARVAGGDILKSYEARMGLMRDIEAMARLKGRGLSADQTADYRSFVGGFSEINKLSEKLSGFSDQLRKFAPKLDDRYTKPKFETDWHDALLDIGIAALQSNLTNVLTVGSGRGEFFGSWKGIGVKGEGHGLGHTEQVGVENWIKIRQYNCEMLIKIMKALEAIPEGPGTMMDNTLIVYTSNNADKQHTDGAVWPFVLLGNGGGMFKTGRYTHLDNRPINDLYTTFLHGVGSPVDHFNVDKNMIQKINSKAGPIEELMA